MYFPLLALNYFSPIKIFFSSPIIFFPRKQVLLFSPSTFIFLLRPKRPPICVTSKNDNNFYFSTMTQTAHQMCNQQKWQSQTKKWNGGFKNILIIFLYSNYSLTYLIFLDESPEVAKYEQWTVNREDIIVIVLARLLVILL